MSSASFAKREREKAQKQKAAAKAERRAERAAEDPAETLALTEESEQALMASLAELHQRYDAGDIELEEFMDAREKITERLHST